jgi:hypothetical protein
MGQRSTALHEALEDAALAGAREIREFLGTYRGQGSGSAPARTSRGRRGERVYPLAGESKHSARFCVEAVSM